MGQDESQTVGCLGLPEAPVFYPTEEEFADPYLYIENIRQEAEPYGICRIVPPSTWNPPFAIDTKSFIFPTKLQEIHHLQVRPAARDAETFKLEYCRFLEKQGLKVGSWPAFLGKELDLCKLFSAVKRHGGYQKVSEETKWGEVLQILDPECMSGVETSSLQSTLCNLYESHLQAYEAHQACSYRHKRHRAPNGQEANGSSRGKRNGRRRADDVEAKAEETHMDDSGFRADQVCEQCHSGAHEQLMLLCDRCDRGWHLYCLTPPLSAVPPGNWYCFDCLTSETESFGFMPGETRSFESFRRLADRFKKKWFGGKEATLSEIEDEFWSVVERCKGPVEVLYGSDLASEIYGSGFPRSSDPVPGSVDETLWKKYAASPWNLNNFTKLKASVLKHVQENIPGVTVPWVYMGMLFSSFCWHYEDQCFYSINYLHWGEPKCWYGVPGSAVNAFEQVMHKTFPDLFEAQPDLLFQLVTMLNPKVLCENDVPVCTTIQERGNFVITFPRSYHGGFNHGLNCAEAVNFATLDWLPYGRFAVERTRIYHKAAVLSHEELLCVITKNARGLETSPWLKEELNHMIALEKKQRTRLWRVGIIKSSRMVARQFPNVIGTEEDPVCIICRYHLFMSALTCSCCPGKAVCLQHSEQLCECSRDHQCLLYRYSLAELDNLQMEIQCPELGQSSMSRGGNKGKSRRRYKQSEAMMAMKKMNGSMVSHTKLAEVWLTKAESVLRMVPHPSIVETSLAEAEEFLWAGHEMDNVRLVVRELQCAKSWAQGVAACINAVATQSEKPERASLITAQELLAVNPFPCDIEQNVVKLKRLVDRAVDLQHEAKIFLSSNPPWEPSELEALQQKLAESPLKFLEAEQIQEIVQSTVAWGNKVRGLLVQHRFCWTSGQRNSTDMDKLHKLQLEGDKLPVVLPEMEVLESFVNKLTKWQKRAKDLLVTTAPLQVAEELLLEVEDVPVYIPEAEILEQRTFEANEWKKCAHKVLADVCHQTYYTASIDLLSSLINVGESLDIEVKEVDLVKMELKKLLWHQRAAKGVQCRSTINELLDIMEEATNLSLESDPMYFELHHIVEDAQAWECKALDYLEKGASLDDYRVLRRDSGKIYATLSGWIGINVSIMQAESFLDTAEPLLLKNQQINSGLTLDYLQALLNQSHNLRVDLPEKAHLYALLEDINSWTKRAGVFIQSAKDALQASDMEGGGLTLSSTVLEDELLLVNLRSSIAEGKLLGFELPELSELEVLATATEWHLRASQLLVGCPSIKELESFVHKANFFPSYIGQLKLLQCTLNKAKEWSEKVQNTMHEKFSSSSCTVGELESLLKEAKDLQVDVSSDLAYLEGLLASHKLWKNQISKCLYPPHQAVSWEELCRLQDRKAHIIKCEEVELLEKELVKSEAWVSKCFFKLLNHSNAISIPLIELLMKVRSSIDNALQQLQNKSYKGQEEVCRLCRACLHSSSLTFSRCENCGDSYHTSCLGLAQSQERAIACSFCTAFMAGVLWLDEGILSKICITKRPTIGALQELLEAAKGINIRLEEVQLLQCIVRRVQAWQTCLNEIVEPVLRPHSNEVYSSSSLLSALKIAGTMEVQGNGNSKLALALSVNAWRMNCRSVIESPTKPSYRAIRRILEEGSAIPCLAHDSLLKELETWEAMASEWHDDANKVVEDNGVTPVEDVLELIVEGERLPVAFNEEIAALRSRTVLYCICKKPYDKDRAMIACDYCSEWYHFDCVNLPEPESSDDECEAMLQRYGSSSGEFLCSDCKGLGRRETPKLTREKPKIITKVVNDRNEGLKELVHSSEESLYTPPLWYARGKRSSRSSMRVRVDSQERWQSHSRILYCASTKNISKTAETFSSSSGRPCRRTAGQNSRFESFVLLMHSG